MNKADVAMENMEKRELISALADGQLAGDAFARGVELAAADASAREAWHDYHLIGDVLRSSELASGAPSSRFVARLQVRLREEQIAIDPLEQTPIVSAHPAANDFRWKLVAGVASVAAVSAIAWTLVGAPVKQDAPQLAATTAPAGTVFASTKQGVMIRDARLDELLAAHRQLGGAALVAPAGYLRNAAFDGTGR